jgi:hypothetical protein
MTPETTYTLDDYTTQFSPHGTPAFTPVAGETVAIWREEPDAQAADDFRRGLQAAGLMLHYTGDVGDYGIYEIAVDPDADMRNL